MTVEAKISNAEMEYLESLRRWKQAKSTLALAQIEHTRARIAFNKAKKHLEVSHPAARHDGKIKVRGQAAIGPGTNEQTPIGEASR